MTFDYASVRQEEMAAVLKANGRYKILRLFREDVGLQRGRRSPWRQDNGDINDCRTSISRIGDHFDVQDALKGRGYRCDVSSSVRGHEIRDSERDAEEAWLAKYVCAPCHLPCMSGLTVTDVTWYQRHV